MKFENIFSFYLKNLIRSDLSFEVFQMKRMYNPSCLKFEVIVIPFIREKEEKVSSALTQKRRNARFVAKRMFETFFSFSLMKGSSLTSIESFKTQTRGI